MVTQIILRTALRQCNNTESLQTHGFLIVSSKKERCLLFKIKKNKNNKKKTVLSCEISCVTQKRTL